MLKATLMILNEVSDFKPAVNMKRVLAKEWHTFPIPSQNPNLKFGLLLILLFCNKILVLGMRRFHCMKHTISILQPHLILGQESITISIVPNKTQPMTSTPTRPKNSDHLLMELYRKSLIPLFSAHVSQELLQTHLPTPIRVRQLKHLLITLLQFLRIHVGFHLP
jgi:hypothetical protein